MAELRLDIEKVENGYTVRCSNFLPISYVFEDIDDLMEYILKYFEEK